MLSCPACVRTFSLFLKVAEREHARCPSCGGMVVTAPEQFASVSVEREWLRARNGQERTSLDLAFAKDADMAAIKRDCPSMELKADKFGLMRPVSRNDRHDRKWKRELTVATERYQAAEAKAEGAAQ